MPLFFSNAICQFTTKLAPIRIDENKPSNSVIGSFSTFPVGSYTYKLLSSKAAPDDNVSFKIDGNKIRTRYSFDYEIQSRYNVRIRTSDTRGNIFDTVYIVLVNDIKEPNYTTTVTWKQKEFAIMACWDPSTIFKGGPKSIDGLVGKFGNRARKLDERDISLLQDYKDAHFNLLYGGEDRFRFWGNEYILRVIEKVGGLKMLIGDFELRGHSWLNGNEINYINIDVTRSCFNNYKKIDSIIVALRFDTCSNLDQYIYGYNIQDEPHFYETKPWGLLWKRIQLIQNNQESGSPDKLVYLNLYSNRTSEFWDGKQMPVLSRDDSIKYYAGKYDTTKYKRYIDNVINAGAKVISFDNYCFIKYGYGTSGSKIYICDKFYLNYKIFAEKAIEHKVVFWAVPLCLEHVAYSRGIRTMKGVIPYVKGVVKKAHDGPMDYRVNLTESVLRFYAYVPLLYGAKGVCWYAYRYGKPYSKNAEKFQRAMSWHQDDKALIDASHKKVDTSHAKYGNKPIYTWVQRINKTLKNMGPTIMKLKWVGTFHGSDTNNWISIKSSVDYNGVPNYSLDLKYFETGLPTISHSDNNVIFDFGEMEEEELRTIAASVFTDDNEVCYIMILNKDIDADPNQPVPLYRNYTINFKYRTSKIWKHNKIDSSWKKVNLLTDYFQTRLKPGDIELISLSNPQR